MPVPLADTLASYAPRSTTEVVANQVVFLSDSRGGGGGGGRGESMGGGDDGSADPGLTDDDIPF